MCYIEFILTRPDKINATMHEEKVSTDTPTKTKHHLWWEHFERNEPEEYIPSLEYYSTNGDAAPIIETNKPEDTGPVLIIEPANTILHNDNVVINSCLAKQILFCKKTQLLLTIVMQIQIPFYKKMKLLLTIFLQKSIMMLRFKSQSLTTRLTWFNSQK